MLTPILSASHAGQPEMLAEVYQQVETSRLEFFKNQVPLLRALAEKQGLPHEQIVFFFEEGTVLSSVKKLIAEEEIDLIIMGTNGASGFQKSFIGTNTVAVINNVKLPVLAIPGHAKYQPIKNIAFTTLFRDKDEPALQEVISIAEALKSKIYCVNVMGNINAPGDLLYYGETWSRKFKSADLDFVFLEKRQSVEDTIHAFIRENNMDLLAIVKRNRSFFDRLINASLSNKFAFHAETPILVFHEDN